MSPLVDAHPRECALSSAFCVLAREIDRRRAWSEVENGVRRLLIALAIACGTLACFAAPAAGAQPVTTFNTAGGGTVPCLGAPTRGPGGFVSACILGRMFEAQNFYNDGSGGQWTLVFFCVANRPVTFDTAGHTISCTMWQTMVFDNTDAVTKQVHQVTCAVNTQITVDAVGHVACMGGAPTPQTNPASVEDPVADVTWDVEGGQWFFHSNGQIDGLVNGTVVWSGRWAQLGHYLYKYEFSYHGQNTSVWLRFADPQGVGHATEFLGYPSADMSTPFRHGQIAGSP